MSEAFTQEGLEDIKKRILAKQTNDPYKAGVTSMKSVYDQVATEAHREGLFVDKFAQDREALRKALANKLSMPTFGVDTFEEE